MQKRALHSVNALGKCIAVVDADLLVEPGTYSIQVVVLKLSKYILRGEVCQNIQFLIGQLMVGEEAVGFVGCSVGHITLYRSNGLIPASKLVSMLAGGCLGGCRTVIGGNSAVGNTIVLF